MNFIKGTQNLIKVGQTVGTKWHIPRDTADLVGEEVWVATTVCGETVFYDGGIPEGWMRLSDGLSVEEICDKCLTYSMILVVRKT